MASKWLEISCCFSFFQFNQQKQNKNFNIVYHVSQRFSIWFVQFRHSHYHRTNVIIRRKRHTRQTTWQHTQTGELFDFDFCATVQLCTEFKFSVYFKHIWTVLWQQIHKGSVWDYLFIYMHNAEPQVDDEKWYISRQHDEKNYGVEKSINLCWNHRKIFQLNGNTFVVFLLLVVCFFLVVLLVFNITISVLDCNM